MRHLLCGADQSIRDTVLLSGSTVNSVSGQTENVKQSISSARKGREVACTSREHRAHLLSFHVSSLNSHLLQPFAAVRLIGTYGRT